MNQRAWNVIALILFWGILLGWAYWSTPEWIPDKSASSRENDVYEQNWGGKYSF